MSLLKYNINYAIRPVGFINLGYTCYYNSLLQSLLSCTSFIEEIMSNQEVHKKDLILGYMIELIARFNLLEKYPGNQQIKSEINNLGPITWKAMIKKISMPPDGSIEFAQFAMGQQCAAEGFTLLIQALDNFQGIQNLFEHRRQNKIYCKECKTWFSEVIETNNMFEVEPELIDQVNPGQTKNLTDFLLNQSSIIDKDCLCSNCGIRGNKHKTSKLTMVPEILFVVSKKYKYSMERGDEKINVYTEFPAKLEFNSNSDDIITYEAVAQIEHYGNTRGGHYVAICKRSCGWFLFNDMGISHSEFKPTNNTYIVLYHVV